MKRYRIRSNSPIEWAVVIAMGFMIGAIFAYGMNEIHPLF